MFYDNSVKYPKNKIWSRLSVEARSRLFEYLNGRLPTYSELFGEEDPMDLMNR